MSSSYHHKKFAHLRIPREEIVSSTNNFSEANLIKKDEETAAYRGQLLRSGQSVDILALVWPNNPVANELFWMEVSMLSILKHENLASLVGFCEEDDEIIMIYQHYHTLVTFLKDPTLTWMRRLQIFVGVAQALSYLKYEEGRDFSVIHCNICSENIMLDDQWNAKLCGFHISLKQIAATRNPVRLHQFYVAGAYTDPTSVANGYASHKLDIYSFGVVLFEGLTGEKSVKDRLLAPLARTCYEEGRLDDMIFPGLQKQMDPRSVKIVSETAYYCLKEQPSQRPNIQQILKKLTEALECQRKHENPFLLKPYSMVEGTTSTSLKENPDNKLKICFEDISRTVQDFSDDNLIAYFTRVYRGEFTHANQSHSIVAKVFGTDAFGKQSFLRELQVLSKYKHENIVALVGYCNEEDNKIIVSEYASRGCLALHLSDSSLTWMKRLEICVDIASGLDFLHGGGLIQELVVHRDINTAHILLDDDWKAKICSFTTSFRCPVDTDVESVIDNECGFPAYRDPLYMEMGFLTTKSDIYSFGLVLFEILCGGVLVTTSDNGVLELNPELMMYCEDRTLHDRCVFKSIKQQIAPRSLSKFIKIAYQCLDKERHLRPTAHKVLLQLRKALECQRDFEIWSPKLPDDYKEILKTSNPGFRKSIKGIYDLLCKGILRYDDKVIRDLQVRLDESEARQQKEREEAEARHQRELEQLRKEREESEARHQKEREESIASQESMEKRMHALWSKVMESDGTKN